MSDQREMTLDEYLESKLPDFHLARRQLQELREERDAWQRMSEQYRREAYALAANVERLTRDIEGALRIKDLWLPAHCDPEHEGECQALGKMYSAFARALEESPTAPLDRLIAENVEAALGHVEGLMEAGASPGDAIAETRRQAEGGKV